MTFAFDDVSTKKLCNLKQMISRIIVNKDVFRNSNIVKKECVVAGGFFASWLNNEEYQDIDVFILNNSRYVFDSLTYDVKTNTSNWVVRKQAGTYLKNPHILETATFVPNKVQYILTDYTSRKELIDSFDYKHTTVSYDPHEDKLYITPKTYQVIRNKELVINGNNIPDAWREEKFVNRGWKKVNRIPNEYTSLKESFQHLNDKYNQAINHTLGDMLDLIKKRNAVDPYQKTK